MLVRNWSYLQKGEGETVSPPQKHDFGHALVTPLHKKVEIASNLMNSIHFLTHFILFFSKFYYIFFHEHDHYWLFKLFDKILILVRNWSYLQKREFQENPLWRFNTYILPKYSH